MNAGRIGEEDAYVVEHGGLAHKVEVYIQVASHRQDASQLGDAMAMDDKQRVKLAACRVVLLYNFVIVDHVFYISTM